ncbi:MAG: hypothetical protein HY652_01945 [Acidobacteria bacterium]|nr:hypothetical protein [Acidobacteriota bacterium]
MNHISALVVFSIAVAAVFACIAKETPREQLRYFLFLLGALVVSSLVAAWIMYPFPF